MARKDPNRRLTTLDASFLYCEKPKEPLHIGACTIYEGHISREALMHTFLERLHMLPATAKRRFSRLLGWRIRPGRMTRTSTSATTSRS